MYRLAVRRRSRWWWLVVVTMVGLVGWAVAILSQIHDEVAILHNKTLPALRAAGDLCENGYELESRVLRLPAGAAGERAAGEVKRLERESLDLLEKYRDTIVQGADRQNLDKVSASFAAYASALDRLVATRRAGGAADPSEMLARSAEFRQALSDLRDFRHARADERMARSGSGLTAALRLHLVLLSCVTAGIVAAAALLAVVRKRPGISPGDF